MPLFQKWLQSLEDYGYYTNWAVLNAKDYGVPQNRERCFAISIRRDLLDPSPVYHFPEPLPLELSLKDVFDEVSNPVIIDDTFGYESENRFYSEYSPTIRSERSGLKVAEPRIIKEGKQMANTLDTGCQQGVVERYNDTSYGETRVFETINKTNTKEALCLLRSKVGKEAFQRQIGGLIDILKEEVLRQGMHEESLCSDRTDIARDRTSSSLFTEDSVLDTTETNGVRGMREDNEYRCPSQRSRLSKQFTNEFNTIVSQLPSEDAQTKECVSYLWRACEGSQSLQQTLDTMEEVWGSPAPTVEYT